MQTMKFLIVATVCFLAGLSSNLFMNDNTHVIYQEAQHRKELPPIQQATLDQGLYQSIEDIKYMLAEQSVRLETTEENISYLLNLNESGVEATTSEELYLVEEKPQLTQQFYDAESYVDEQMEKGFWSADNVQEVMQMSAKLSHQHRTEIGLKIVQAINSGQMEVENITMPLF